MNFPSDALLLRALKTLGSDTTSLGACSLGLIAAPFTPSRGLLIASLTEATFNGYVRKSLGTTTTTFTSSDGNDYLEWPSQLFTPTGSTTPNTIYGAFLLSAADTVTVTYSEAFTPPVPMTGTTSNLTYIPRFGQAPTIAWGNGVLSS